MSNVEKEGKKRGQQKGEKCRHAIKHRNRGFDSYAAFQFCRKVGNSGLKLGQTSKEDA